MFKQDIDLDNKAEMISFLKNHFRYYTMHSWNKATSYANNVKLHLLNISERLHDRAYDFLEAECDDFEMDVIDLISEFEHSTGYTAGFNGRSNGYIVLYDTKFDEKTSKHHAIFNDIDRYADFKEWDIEELRDRVNLVQALDRLCDEIREVFLFYVEHTTIKTIEETRSVIRRVAVMPDC